jgi:hypothetical protein
MIIERRLLEATQHLGDQEFEAQVAAIRSVRAATAAAVAEQQRAHEWSRGISTAWQTRQIAELRLAYARVGFAGPSIEREILRRVYG